MVNPIQHQIIKEAGESIGKLLQDVFRENGYKRVNLVGVAPKQDALEGKLPALSIYLYNLVVDYDGSLANGGSRFYENQVGASGESVEVERRGPMMVRLDYLISTWAQTPEEEQLLMGGVLKALLENQVIEGERLKGSSMENLNYLPVTMAQKLDEGVLSRFWASLNQPLRPAVQCWTVVPIFPSGATKVQRVQDRDVRFFDLGKMRRAK